MDLTCKRDGLPVRSRGLFQISRCYHPEISDAQAFDIASSTEWAMSQMQDLTKCYKEWTACKKYITQNKNPNSPMLARADSS